MESHDPFVFFTDKVRCKSEGDGESKKFYVEGYAATTDVDVLNEMCSAACLKSILTQIKGSRLNIKLDDDHEVWREKNGTLRDRPKDFIPVGKIIDAQLKSQGLYIKAELNKHVEGFKSFWGSIKDGFIDAFSIAYHEIKVATKSIGERTIRVLDDVKLLNVALTGTPVNPAARITSVMAKSLAMNEEPTEVDKMTDEKTPEPEKKDDVTPAPEETAKEPEKEPEKAETPAEPTTPAEAPKEESKVAVKSLAATVEALKLSVKSLEDANTKQDAEVVKVKARLASAEVALGKPRIKSLLEETPTKVPQADKTPLQTL